MRWARLVLAVVLVVGWTATAAAECVECVWVLWVYNSSNAVWTINGATPSYDQCERRKVALMLQAVSDIKPDKDRIKAFEHNYKFMHKVLGERFYCLPDTIDPRERKD